MGPGVAASVVLAAAVVGGIVYVRHRRGRDRLYADLAAHRPAAVQQFPVTIRDPDSAAKCVSAFGESRLVTVPEFLPATCLSRLCEEAVANLPRAERSFIPTHKKGGTVSYESISRYAPACLAFYHSPVVQEYVSKVTGVPVCPTPDQDQSSLSLLCYTEAGDHINWHYDHNFYRGRHFTVLLSLVNQGASGGVSQSQFQRKRPSGDVQSSDTPPNTLVIFEGARVLHRATGLGVGERRLMLSMTYSADPRISRLKEAVRRAKDMAFYGIRALWD